MMDVLLSLITLAALIGGWILTARALRRRGSGFLVRHLLGAVAGLAAMFAALMVAAMAGLIEPAPAETAEGAAAPEHPAPSSPTSGSPAAPATPRDEQPPVEPAAPTPRYPVAILENDGRIDPWPFKFDEATIMCMDSGALWLEDTASSRQFSLDMPQLRFIGPDELSPLSDALAADATEETLEPVVERARALCAARRDGTLGDDHLSIDDLPGAWPFTVDAVRLVCADRGAVFVSAYRWLRPTQLYPLNGAARGRASELRALDLEEIWAESADTPGTRVSLGRAIDLAVARCAAR